MAAPLLHSTIADREQESAAFPWLAASTASAEAMTPDSATPLHQAAAAGCIELAQVLLKMQPSALTAADSRGRLPLHCAIAARQSQMVRLLLREAPGTARALNAFPNACCRGCTPLHWAADACDADTVAWLLAAAPDTAAAANAHGHTPLHFCILSAHRPELPISELLAVAQLLIKAAPASAGMADTDLDTPLHCAALQGCPELVRLLAAAAPCTVTALNRDGQLPLECALQQAAEELEQGKQQGQRQAAVQAADSDGGSPPPGAFMQAASALLAHMPTGVLLPALVRAGPAALPLYAELAASRQLTAEQWQQLPAPCPGLAAALPAALARSTAEAACLVRCLPDADRQRLHMVLLALRRVQLPQDVARHILCRLFQ